MSSRCLGGKRKPPKNMFVEKVGDRIPVSSRVFNKYFARAVGDNNRVVRGHSHDDGSCFFHALAVCLSNAKGMDADDSAGLELRRAIARTINKRDWKAFWENEKGLKYYPTSKSLRKMMDNPSTWADVWIILWTAHVLGINILFWDSKTDDLYCGLDDDGMDERSSAYIWWANNVHFEPIVVLSKDLRHPIIGMFNPLHARKNNDPHSELNKKIVQSVKNSHTKICKNVTLKHIIPR